MKWCTLLLLIAFGCDSVGQKCKYECKPELKRNDARVVLIEEFDTDFGLFRFIRIDGMLCLQEGRGLRSEISCDWASYPKDKKVEDVIKK